MRYIINIFTLLFVLTISSCNTDEGCRKDKYVKLQLGIYHVTYNNTTNSRTAVYLNIDSITVKGIGIDSVLYNNTKKINSVTLPLNKAGSTNIISAFEIAFNNITDTITIIHNNQSQYLSLECGSIVTHKIDTVLTTNHFIDSVSISVHDVNTSTSAKEHIKIYK